jgi:hypothetical protein
MRQAAQKTKETVLRIPAGVHGAGERTVRAHPPGRFMAIAAFKMASPRVLQLNLRKYRASDMPLKAYCVFMP